MLYNPMWNGVSMSAVFQGVFDRCVLCDFVQGDPEKRLGHRGAGEVKLHPWFQVRQARCS